MSTWLVSSHLLLATLCRWHSIFQVLSWHDYGTVCELFERWPSITKTWWTEWLFVSFTRMPFYRTNVTRQVTQFPVQRLVTCSMTIKEKLGRDLLGTDRVRRDSDLWQRRGVSLSGLIERSWMSDATECIIWYGCISRYKIMSDCWLANNDLRPSFSKLVDFLLMHMDPQVLVNI